MGSKFSRMNITKDKSTNKEMFIMRQRENAAEAISSVDIFDDEESAGHHNSLQNKIGEKFTRLFERNSPSSYRAENLTMSTLVALISSIQGISWTISTTNAYLDVQTNEIVTTFYFERPSKFPMGGALSNPSFGSHDVSRSLHASTITTNAAPATRSRSLLSMTNAKTKGVPISASPIVQASRDSESLGSDNVGAEYLNVVKKKYLSKGIEHADIPNEQKSIADKLPSSKNVDFAEDRRENNLNEKTPQAPPLQYSQESKSPAAADNISLAAEAVGLASRLNYNDPTSKTAGSQNVQLSDHANIDDTVSTPMESAPVAAVEVIASVVAQKVADAPAVAVYDGAVNYPLASVPTTTTAQAGGPLLPHSFLPAPRAAASPARGSVAVDDKNAAFFKRMKEEEAMKKQLEAEKEAKMDPSSLAVLRGAREQQMQHDANKTAHYSRLGENFLATREAGKGPAHVLAAGRGRGSGVANINNAKSSGFSSI